jgi:hypothetical protein
MLGIPVVELPGVDDVDISLAILQMEYTEYGALPPSPDLSSNPPKSPLEDVNPPCPRTCAGSRSGP